MTDNIIEIDSLNKRYGSLKAVNDLSFKVKRGELFAFLGVNGAGKSTTINIMCGQLSKDSGKVMIDGRDMDREAAGIKRELGVVFQDSVLDAALSVYDNLESRAVLYGMSGQPFRKRFDELAALLDFSDLKNGLWESFPADSGAASILQGRCSTGPRYLSWTSRPPDWTPRQERAYGMSSLS